jgi:hypothetical protein
MTVTTDTTTVDTLRRAAALRRKGAATAVAAAGDPLAALLDAIADQCATPCDHPKTCSCCESRPEIFFAVELAESLLANEQRRDRPAEASAANLDPAVIRRQLLVELFDQAEDGAIPGTVIRHDGYEVWIHTTGQVTGWLHTLQEQAEGPAATEATDTVLALVHTGCGHAAAVSGEEDELDDYAKRSQLGPEWEVQELPRHDAVDRYRAGGGGQIMQPCVTCRIEAPVLEPAGDPAT